MIRFSPAWLLIVICLAVIVLANLISPYVGLLAAIAIFIGIASLLKPVPIACALAFMTSAFPKAGIKLGAFPFPIFLLGLVFAFALAWGSSRPEHRHAGSFRLPALALVGVVLSRVILISSTGLSTIAPLVAWTLVPMALYLLGRGMSPQPAMKIARSIEYGFLLAIAYGIAQLALGISTVSVPGLTSAYGDDLSRKHNSLIGLDGKDYSKIPSTYQNGNIFGLVAATFCIIALWRVCVHQARRKDYVLLIGSVVIVGFSGSRTAIVASIFGFLAVFVFQGGRASKKLLVLALTFVAATIVVSVQPDLANRYTIAALDKTGGSGRSTFWHDALVQFHWSDWLFGDSRLPGPDGWVGMIMQVGLVGIICIACFAMTASQGVPMHRMAFLVLGVGAFFDSSYDLFPTWFIVAAYLATSSQDVEALITPKVGNLRPIVNTELRA